MAENDIDLYGDDIDQDFAQDEYTGDNVDLYDDVIATGTSNNSDNAENKFDSENTNGSLVPTVSHNSSGRRHQLYVGNLTWWTTDQDIGNAIHSLSVNDFHEVKFFEHRANGQSKGFCVISLGSEASMRKCMEMLPKKEIHGQMPHVTLTTKQALLNFESQSKTRPVPPNNSNSRPPHPSAPNNQGGPMQNFGNRMPMNQGPNMRGGPPMGPPGMQDYGGPRMQGPPGFNGPINMQQQQQPPRFQVQPQWNGPRPNGPGPNMGNMRPPSGPGPQCQPRPGLPMFQGPPQGQPPRMPLQHNQPPPGPRMGGPGDWNRPAMQQGFPQGPPPMQQAPPRGPPPMQGPPGVVPNQGPAPHVNPAFFPPAGGPPPMQMGGPGPGPGMVMQQAPPHGPPHGPPMGPQQPPPHGPPHGYGPPGGMSQPPYGGPPPDHRPDMPPINEQEFEDIMSRNRTVSSSAIARAVSDAAAGEYSSAIETLVTAISLIKQSKVANDDRCKILISSLQDTLRGVENKSYSTSSRHDRSRSRDRTHRRGSRRERSSSRYRERSRERERDRDRDRERDRDRYYSESYRERDRERDRSRSRGDRIERDRERDYRERETEEPSRVSRPRNKSPVETPDASGDAPSKSRYYDERYRDRERERERESGRTRESERDRGDRERERREESHRSRH